MSNLIVITYPDQYRAAEVLATLQRLQKEYLIDLEDSVYVTKDAQGNLKLHQSQSMTGAGAMWGGLWGLLIGALFFVPVFGLALGAGMGALAGSRADFGIDENFARQLTAQMQPNTSALFVLVRKSTPDKVLPEVAKFGGTVMQTSLTSEAQAKLQAALDEAQAKVQQAQPQTAQTVQNQTQMNQTQPSTPPAS